MLLTIKAHFNKELAYIVGGHLRDIQVKTTNRSKKMSNVLSGK